MKLTKFSTLPGSTPIAQLTDWARGRPIYCQPKHHGIFAEYIPGIGLFTRQGKKWNLSRFPDGFQTYLAKYKDHVLHGELVIPNVPFPEAAGALSVVSDIEIPSTIQYRLFDTMPLNSSDITPFGARLAMLSQFTDSYHINVTTTTVVYDSLRADQFYHSCVEKSYEGCVYRVDPCYWSNPSTPNPDAVKRKKLHSMEGICYGVEEGAGKRKGMLGSLTVKLDNNQYVKLGGGAGMTDELLMKLWNKPPLGKAVTFTYEEMSENGIPLRPQFVSLRTYE